MESEPETFFYDATFSRDETKIRRKIIPPTATPLIKTLPRGLKFIERQESMIQKVKDKESFKGEGPERGGRESCFYSETKIIFLC